MPGYITDQQSATGSFIPTTAILDVALIHDTDVQSDAFKNLIVRLYQTVNNISLVLNTKDSALYLTEEFNTGQQYFNPASLNQLDLRPSFRKVIDLGALAAGVKNVAHGLTPTNTWKFVSISGAATNTAALTYFPLPFAGVGVGNISVVVNATNVVINNGSGTVFTDAYVTLVYLKM